MFTIDNKFDDAMIAQFADQAKYISPEFRKVFDANFKGDQSLDYYKGLIVGFGNAYEIANTYNPGNKETQFLGQLVAYVAEKYLDKHE